MKKQGCRRFSKVAVRKRFLWVETLEARQLLTASPGWDGAGLGTANLTYHIENAPKGLTYDQVESAIQTALKAWSDVVDVNFTETSQSGLANSIDISFALIDGSNGILGQAYFPSSSARASSQAGDVTFDSSEAWEIGNSLGSQAVDLVAVAVHELGHALGLDHSSDPDSIMYPSISAAESFSGLSQGDIAAIRSIYAARDTSSDSGSSDSRPTAGDDSGTGTTTGSGTGTTTGAGTTSGTGTGTTGNNQNIDPRLMAGVLVTINDKLIDDFFTKYDTNSDQALSSDELPAQTMRLLKQLNFDTDQDDSISLAEFKTGISTLQKNFFDKIDKDASGSIGQSEVSSGIWTILSHADLDADGSVSFDEFVAFQQKSLFEKLDGNQDSQISQDEVPTKLWNQLSRFDTDQNGTISAEEFANIPTQLPPSPHHHGGHFAGHGNFGGRGHSNTPISASNNQVTVRISPFSIHRR